MKIDSVSVLINVRESDENQPYNNGTSLELTDD